MSDPATPRIQYPEDLPVSERRKDIARAIEAHQVVIVAGETGSGKTTQLPKICLELGRGSEGRIGHTQPRRLAARTVAARIAQELEEPIGETVGYQVRFTDRVAKESRVKLMTDGILLAEIQRDRMLRQYDTLIIDEAHERSLNIDFLLGYLKQLLPRRPDLKLLITSATIDVESFSRHFESAPVIEVSGRSYPITTHYLDPADSDGVMSASVDAVRRVVEREFGDPGDILVFLSGEREIRELAHSLRREQLPGLEVLPLYARLSQAEQNRVFETGKRRGIRAVLATNVAETSITVPGIRYVIDTGLARISRYSYRSRTQRLPIEAISQASANQRQGRCGRVGPGVCLRLYGEEDFLARPEYTEPEIQRTSLASVILRMLRLKLGDIANFPFINPPDSRLVRDGFKLLEELGAVSESGQLARPGRQLADIPVDPRFGRMLLEATQRQCLREVLVIVSALSVQDPRERPVDKQQAADEKHRRFRDEQSDFMAWLALWDYFEEQRQALSQNRLRKLCKQEYLSYMRMREWRDIHFQLTIACRQLGLEQNKEPADYEAVHRSLISGLLSNIAQQAEGREYRGARNRILHIFPGSSQYRKKPAWLVAAEVVETSQVYARCTASIDPVWALEANPSLLKYHYYEPRWQARSGRVMATRRTSLYGLVLQDRKRVHYGPIDAPVSRELMIRQGLVEGRMRMPPAFLRHNLKLVSEVEQLESRYRRRDLLADEERQFAFYDERLPPDITTLSRLKSWLKKEPSSAETLRMGRQDLMMRELDEQLGQQFPDRICWDDLELELSYHFEPGHPADGVSVTIPVGLLNRVPRYLIEWLVPGLLREKCIQLVKGLPKSIRKTLVPVPDYVDRALAQMEPVDKPLVEELAAALKAVAGATIAARDWDIDRLDDYYRMNVRVVGGEGELLRQGRNLGALIEESGEETRQSLQQDSDSLTRHKGLRRWDIGELPENWRSRQAGHVIESYPALVDRGDAVDVELLDYPWQAEQQHRLGLVRLYRLQCADQVRYLRKQLLRGNAASLLLAGAGLDREVVLEDLVQAVFRQSLLEDVALPRDEASFKAILSANRAELVGWGSRYEEVLLDALEGLGDSRKRLAGMNSPATQYAREDMNRQLHALFQDGFLYHTPWQWVQAYPRYTRALHNRLQRLDGQVHKDQGHTETLTELEQPLIEELDLRPDMLRANPELSLYRWMIEELRVSFFAQSLGTARPVSVKRLREQWSRVEAWNIENPV